MQISVIVPVRNEEASIGALLECLLNQTLPPAEIAITDGGSTDATTAIIQKYIDRGAPVRLIRTTRALPGRGRNLAVSHSSSDWLAFTDAGIEPQPDWLALLAEQALRRRVWETVGGFPEHLRSAEDLLFMNQVEEKKFRIAYAPRALVGWDLQPNFRRTFKRFAVYARNNIRAGLWKDWQAAVLSRYLMLVLLTLPAVALGWRWLFVPLGLWLLMVIARATVSIRRNRHCYPGGPLRNFFRLLLLLPLIAVIDLGAIAGSIQWFFTDKLRSGPGAVKVNS